MLILSQLIAPLLIDGILMAGDDLPGMPYKHMKGFTLLFNYNTADQTLAIFKALAEDGTVVMPMQPDFRGKPGVW